jgi:serine/threonine-protein kinase
MTMDANRWQTVKQVLDSALAADPARWPALLDEKCAGDPDLRREVEELLEGVDEVPDFLSAPPSALAAAIIDEAQEQRAPRVSYEGRRLGAYRIVREVGRGGMSRVFLGERVDGHFEQQVALKLLRAGFDSDVDVERFRAERQILASLNHPHIARLLDGGATDEGLPYLAIEYIDGTAIDTYADQQGLGIRERVVLFRTVCQATQYAHRSLVIHRDLKPSNIFVTRDGVVKLLDFGLAKLLEPGGEGSQTIRRWMTPAYAAPEQIRGEAVTTLTDVYQLGAVLYELLAGAPPFDGHGAGLQSLEQAALRDEPEPPSSVAARSGRLSVAREVRGDLDAIVLKALQKEPEERFDSVTSLDRDLGAWLAGYSVQARRGSTWYRARRFVRRHRIETVAVTSISLSLVAAAGISLAAARRAGSERDRAERASHESEAVSTFLMRLFEASDPAEAQGDTLTAAELLRRAAARADETRGPPAAQARMLEVTAQLYHSLGHFREAITLLDRAVEQRRRSQPPNELALAQTLRQLSLAQVRDLRVASGDSTLRHALTLQERLLGPDHPDVASTLRQMASVAVARGDVRLAEVYARRAVVIGERAFGPQDTAVATSRFLLGSVFRRQGRLDDAEREYRAAWETYERVLGPDAPGVADVMLHVAYIEGMRGRNAEAEQIIRGAIEIRRRALGAAHPLVAWATADLAPTFAARGDLASAIDLSRQATGILRRAYGSTHAGVALSIQSLAQYLHQAGQLAEAEASYREAIAIRKRLFGHEDAGGSGAETGLATVLADRGDYQTAESLLRLALQRQHRVFGAAHPNTAIVEARLGMLLTRMGGFMLADSLLQHARATMERQTSRQSPDVRQIYGFLADLETARRRPEEAARYRAIAMGR